MKDVLEKIVERDLLIMELEQIRDSKRRTAIEVLIDEATGFGKAQLERCIEVVEKIADLNDELGIGNEGDKSPRSLLSELKKIKGA